MFVLVDYEWVEKPCIEKYGTQLAAWRMDHDWNIVDRFYMQFKPNNKEPVDFSNMAFGGLDPEVYLNAPPGKEVFAAFQAWLKNDDQLYIWAGRTITIFKKAMKYALEMKRFGHQVYNMRENLYGYLGPDDSTLGSPYDLCRARNWSVPEQEHYSPNDLEALRTLIVNLKVDQAHVLREDMTPEEVQHRCILDHYHRLTPHYNAKFYHDPVTGLVHKADCPELKQGMFVEGYDHLTDFKKTQLSPCKCIEDIWEPGRLSKLERIRTLFPNSLYARDCTNKLVHYWDCPELRKTRGYHIEAISRFEKALSDGSSPCPVCNPGPNDAPESKARAKEMAQARAKAKAEARAKAKAEGKAEGKEPAGKPEEQKKPAAARPKKEAKAAPVKAPVPAPNPEPVKPPVAPPQPETPDEAAAMKRYNFLTGERKRLLASLSLSPVQKQDIMTLTEPQFGFWVASGYRNFHRRECPKLRGMSELKGYATIGDALNDGNSPCKICKPTKKDNVRIYIPLESVKREGETPESILRLCAVLGMNARYEDPYLLSDSDVSRWRLDLRRLPAIPERIDLVAKNEKTDYRELDKRYLSFEDAVQDIHSFDTKLSDQVKTGVAKINAFKS